MVKFTERGRGAKTKEVAKATTVNHD